jgi:predicted NBD/HSP70 family sugar kinase
MEKLMDKHIRKLTKNGVVDALLAAGKTMDPVQLFETAHAVKGVCANLGLVALSEAASEIAEAYRPGCARTMTTEQTAEKLEECRKMGRETKMTELVEAKGKVNGRTAFDGKRMGDPAACEVVDDYVKHLASGLASMVNIFQPEVLSIGGGISNEGQYLLDLVTPLVREQQYGKGLVPSTDIRIATLKNDAGIIGAAVLGL